MFYVQCFLYLCSMNERINWIDWSKFLAVALTIPCHIPHTRGDQPVTYFMVFLLACLMFNSGYLKKERTDLKKEVKKYGYQLGIPYIIYNILFYPYWLIKFYVGHGSMPSISEAMRPVYGTLLLQANNEWGCELNPVTWFIAALFFSHLLLDICMRMRHGSWIMSVFCLIGMGVYVVSKYNYFTTHYVIIGISKSLIFYYMGVLCRKYHLFESCHFQKDLSWFMITFVISIILFNYHAGIESNFTLHMLSYFPTVLFGLLAFIYFCKMLNSTYSQIIVNYSNGTMVFIGLHWMIVGLIRYGILKPFFHVPHDYIYTPLETYSLGLVTVVILYPVILLFHAKMPWMLGKRG